MPKRLSGWLLGAAVGVLCGGILAMDAVADAQAATLVVEVELDGADAEGTVQVLAHDGTIVTEGAAHEPLRVAPGTYEVRVTCRDAHAARVLRAVELVGRATARRVVRFAAPH